MADLRRRGLFLAFLRLGATAYGGPAMIAHFKAELVDRRRWVTEQDFSEGMALCQAIPGATMVQMSTYVGYRLRGISGALAAALGFVLPACIAMIVLSALYFHSATLPVIRALFRGLGAVVVAIVLDACLRLGRTTVQGWQGALVALLALGALVLKVHFIVILVGAAGLAILLYGFSERRRRGSQGAP